MLVPPGVSGRVVEIVAAGPLRVADVVARIETAAGVSFPCTMFQRWRVRAPRPFRERLPLDVPLITGQRVLDTFFPAAARRRGRDAGRLRHRQDRDCSTSSASGPKPTSSSSSAAASAATR